MKATKLNCTPIVRQYGILNNDWGVFSCPKGVPNKRYTPESKVLVVETMRKEGPSCKEAARQFEVSSDTRVASWERIYLMEGAEGLQIERRGRGSKRQPAKLPPKVEDDLLAEVQRLRAENAYLKTCKPWFWKTSDKRAKNAGDSRTEAKLQVRYPSGGSSSFARNLLLP